MKKLAILLTCSLLVGGCVSFKIGGSSATDAPDPVVKSDNHEEAERQAAGYLRDNAKTPENKGVANALSNSLGPEKKPEENHEKIIKDLRAEIAKQNKEYKELNEKLTNLQKQEAKVKDNKGWWSNFKAKATVSTIILIILCILCPPLVTVLFFIIKRFRDTVTKLVAGIQDVADKDPVQGKVIKDRMSMLLNDKEKHTINVAKERIKRFR